MGNTQLFNGDLDLGGNGNKKGESSVPFDKLDEKDAVKKENINNYHSLENKKYPFFLYDNMHDRFRNTFQKEFPSSKKRKKSFKRNENVNYIIHNYRSNSFDLTNKKGLENTFILSRSKSFYRNILDQSYYVDIESQLRKYQNKKKSKFLKKSNNNLRYSYISNLVIKNIWSPYSKQFAANTIFLFDWDDTLMCTTFLIPSGTYSETNKIIIPQKEKAKIAELDTIVFSILSKSIMLGKVFIITNAGSGWVEFSSTKYYPSTKALINQVNVISARAKYQNVFSGDTRLWKIEAFKEVAKEFDKNLPTNILCFGDSIIEMDAGHQVAQMFKNSFIKTIKFQENPNPSELLKELKLIEKDFMYIYSANKNLAIRVEKKNND